MHKYVETLWREIFVWKDIIRQMSYLFLIVLIVPLRNRQMFYLFLIVLFVPLKTRSYFSVVFFSVSASSVNHRRQRSCGRSCHRMWLHWCHRYRIHQNLQEKARYIFKDDSNLSIKKCLQSLLKNKIHTAWTDKNS